MVLEKILDSKVFDEMQFVRGNVCEFNGKDSSMYKVPCVSLTFTFRMTDGHPLS